MSRLRAFAFILCSSLAVSGPVLAEEDDDLPASASSEAADVHHAEVRGLSSDDLLNIREAASPLGRTIGRLPNGAIVRMRQCEFFNGYEWCYVDEEGGENLSGWTPARYLYSPDRRQTGAVAGDDASGRPDGAPQTASVPIPEPAPRPEAADGVGAIAEAPEPDTDDQAADFPPGLEARFAGRAAPAVEDIPEPEPPRLLALAAAPAPAWPGREEAGAEAEAAGIPVPMPRPIRPGEAARVEQPAPEASRAPAIVETPGSVEPAELAEEIEAAETVGIEEAAEVEEENEIAEAAEAVVAAVEIVTAATPAPNAARAWTPEDTSGEIPCARYLGQPMARCVARATRTGPDAVDVTIVWPDGGTRLIEFRDGAPARSNARGELRFTREGSLNMIRIGGAERFEILDALALQD